MKERGWQPVVKILPVSIQELTPVVELFSLVGRVEGRNSIFLEVAVEID